MIFIFISLSAPIEKIYPLQINDPLDRNSDKNSPKEYNKSKRKSAPSDADALSKANRPGLQNFNFSVIYGTSNNKSFQKRQFIFLEAVNQA